MSVYDIIGRFGSQAKLGKELGLTQQAISRWCARGRIPSKHWRELEALAERDQVSLTRDELWEHMAK